MAFNHEKYIRDTLEGFVAQETDFAYEVLINDDASTDRTAEIIREYAEKYPEIIRPVYQKENQYSQRIPIFGVHLNPMIRGKYVALCEGDDFWTDPRKLQMQFEAMERNPDCAMCTHKIRQVNEDGSVRDEYRPGWDLEPGKLDTAGFLKIRRKYPFHTSSFFMRRELWLELYRNPPAFRKASDVGDEPLLLYMAAHGKILYLPECMSAYRLFSVGSWSSVYKRDSRRILAHAEKMYEMIRLYDEYTGHQYDCGLEVVYGHLLWLRGDFRELAKRKYRPYLRELKISKQAYIYFCSVFPFVEKLRRDVKWSK